MRPATMVSAEDKDPMYTCMRQVDVYHYLGDITLFYM